MHPKQTVPGEYYQVTKQGYRHVGNRFVEVSNNPNYLQVFSRCNELLKFDHENGYQQEDVPKEFSCEQLNENLQPENTVLGKQILASNPKAKFMKLRLSEIKTIKEADEEEMEASKLTLRKEKSQKVLNVQEEDSLKEEYEKLMGQYEHEKEMRVNLQKQYNILLNSAVKNKEDDIVEKRTWEWGKSSKKGKISKRVKTAVLEEDSDEDESEEEVRECRTARVAYHQTQNQNQTIHQKELYDDDFEKMFQQELNVIADKLKGLEESMKTREEKMMRTILQMELKSKEREVQRLAQENMVLKSCKSTNGEINGGYWRRGLFSELVLLVLGLLLGKVLFC